MSFLGTFNSLSARGVGLGLSSSLFNGSLLYNSTAAYVVDINSDGTVLTYADGTNYFIYRLVSGVWTLELQDTSVSAAQSLVTTINKTGTRMVAGIALTNATAPAARVYNYTSGTWTLSQTINTPTGSSLSFPSAGDISDSGDRLVLMDYVDSPYVYTYNSGTSTYGSPSVLFPSGGFSPDYSRPSFNSAGDKFAVGAFSNGTLSRVYVFKYNGTSWVQEAIITNPLSVPHFGNGVALNAAGDVLIIGSPRANTNAGLVYVYRYSGTAWTLSATITPSISMLQWGQSIAVNAAGTRFVASSGNSQQGFTISRPALTYEYNGTSWVEYKRLYPSANCSQNYNSSVAMSDDGSVVAVTGNFIGGTGAGVFIYNI